MTRGLRVNTRKSVRKPGHSGISAEERDEQNRKAFRRWAAECRENGPTLGRGIPGDYRIPTEDKIKKEKG